MPRKVDPAELYMSFVFQEAGTHYVDLAQCLSYMNRKLYRQGMEYAIQDIEVFGQLDSDSTVTIQRPVKGWAVANAWVKGFKHWLAMENDTLREAGASSLKGKYSDFKIAFDKDHDTSANLLPANWLTPAQALALDSTVQYDWEYSKVVIPVDGGSSAPLEPELHLVGADDTTSRSLVFNYALSRSRPQAIDPNTINSPPATAPGVTVDTGGIYSMMEDDGDINEEVLENAMWYNQEPPYLIGNDSAFEFYPGGQSLALASSTTQDILVIRGGASGVSSDNSGPFTTYCGLLKFIVSADAVGSAMIIRMAPGAYNGALARPMQDVN